MERSESWGLRVGGLPGLGGDGREHPVRLGAVRRPVGVAGWAARGRALPVARPFGFVEFFATECLESHCHYTATSPKGAPQLTHDLWAWPHTSITPHDASHSSRVPNAEWPTRGPWRRAPESRQNRANWPCVCSRSPSTLVSAAALDDPGRRPSHLQRRQSSTHPTTTRHR